MPAVPLPASFTACSTIDAMPWRSMSFIVKTWTCESRTAAFSRSSRLRTPMSTVCAGSTLGDQPADARQLRRFRAEQRGERHAVHVAAGRGRRRVHVAVRVDPEQADRQVASSAAPIAPRPRPNRRRGCDRRRARAASRPLESESSAVWYSCLAHLGDVVDVLLALVAPLLRFGNRRRQIAAIDDRLAELRQAFAEPGDAERRRPHVDAAAAAAKVQRHADDVDGTHVVALLLMSWRF